MSTRNSFQTKASLTSGGQSYDYFSLPALAKSFPSVERLPFSLKILLENLLRREDEAFVKADDIRALAGWNPAATNPDKEISFMPARVILQDFTGVPCVVDLAAMRDGITALGGDPTRVNPLQPVELVIDHSVQVDHFASPNALTLNGELEYQRNRERYVFLRWGQGAFQNFRVVPPETGIVHQVNIEYLARVVCNDGGVLYPDTCFGTDSHTTMVNGLGVVGWGVGGIEAEAAMLGQPSSMLIPPVVGCRLTGKLPEGATATDLVLTITEALRKHKVVGKFVEFYGPGLGHLTIADRVTLGNMCPEYGATVAIFPVDSLTLDYLRLTGRSADQVALVEAYAKAQGLFRTEATPDATYSEGLEIDLATIVPSLAGPRRPQDRVALSAAKSSFAGSLDELKKGVKVQAAAGGTAVATATQLEHGSVVIAAITSCTNTSNPGVMIGAGLVAKKAAEKGLTRKPWVKTSLAPGSKVVTEYLRAAGLDTYLDKVGFNLVGYGCTTCIGNSGPLPEEVAKAVSAKDLAVASVLSGNRNFEGRIHAQVKASYLASPPLVVAYALAGTVLCDLTTDALGTDQQGKPVFLRDIWPSAAEVEALVASSLTNEQFDKEYGRIFEGDAKWKSMPAPTGKLFEWDAQSTYVREPPFFIDFAAKPAPFADVLGARALAVLGDSITTDHISPAGAIGADSPAGKYLIEHGVAPDEFNSFGSRRGNHEAMMRGTFGNIRLRNQMVPGAEGPWTRHVPSGEKMSIYDASMRYQHEGTPLVVVAGAEYGSGSSRDWAAKGSALLGIKAIVAQSYERIHRSNLVCMGVLPLQFKDGDSATSLALDGSETYAITGIAGGIEPGQLARVGVTRKDGSQTAFDAIVRIDARAEVEYFRHGGILQMVLRHLLTK